MKVLLTADVKGQGKAGQVVEVSDGYARNYILPKKLGKIATAENLNEAKMKIVAVQHRLDMEKKDAEELAKKLGALGVTIHAKAGENGKLFGSITSKEIAAALMEQHKIDLDKKKIVLKDNIKETGEYKVTVKLYADVPAQLTVTVQV
jgi:large subunit ribosomal protein L9